MNKILSGMSGLLLICIMSSPSFANSEYVDNKDGTVTDTVHGLMWQRSDDGVERAWQDAANYCEDLELAGNSDWQMPSINLLEGLIEPANSPTIPATFLLKPSYYWSSSESQNNIKSAKYVNFFYGNTYAYSKDNTYYVICVRHVKKELAGNLTSSFTTEISPEQPLEVHFSSEIAGGSKPYSIEWDFGDGDTASSQSPVHIFASSGSYKVSLMVADNDGIVTSSRQEVVVKTPGTVVEETSLDVNPPKEKAIEPQTDSAQTAVGAERVENVIVSESRPQDIVSPDLHEPIGEITETTAGDIKSPEPAVPPVADDEIVTTPAQPVVASGESALMGSFLEVSVTDKDISQTKALGHGLLAFAFGNAVSGDADWNKDGIVTSDEVKGYLAVAVVGLSKGKIRPEINFTGDNGICAPQGTTYLLAAGVDLYHDKFTPRPFVEQDIVGLQKVIAEKCLNSKTAVITGEHANRAEFLQSLKKVGGMVGPNDHLIFYFAGLSELQGKRINLLFNDTIKGMTAFTGLFYDDIVKFLKGVESGGTVVLLETSSK